MNMIIVKPRPLVRKFILFAILSILIFSSIGPVYADPDKKEAEAGGWIEAVCTAVPEDFEGSVSVMVSDVETDEVYTIDCLKANGFVGRKKLPYGKYFVDRIYTSDTFYYEGFTDLYSFELTKDMAAAQKIEVEVIKNNVPEGIFEMRQEDVSEEEVSAETTTDPDSIVEEQSNDHNEENIPDTVVEEIDNENKNSTNETLVEDANPDDNFSTKRILRNIGISLLATVTFVGIIGLFVYLIRSRYYEEE